MTDEVKICTVIAGHVGSENAITSKQICAALGWPATAERRVRRIISACAMDWPMIVCARVGDPDGGGGFFVPETYQEIEAYWAHLEDLRARAEAKVRGFERLCEINGVSLAHSALRRAAA